MLQKCNLLAFDGICAYYEFFYIKLLALLYYSRNVNLHVPNILSFATDVQNFRINYPKFAYAKRACVSHFVSHIT